MPEDTSLSFWDRARGATRGGGGVSNLGSSYAGIPGGVADAGRGIAQWAGRKNAPQIGPNPYQGGWDTLIGQLQQQAGGQGPSLAGDAYKQAQQTGMGNILALSNRGGARSAMQQLGQMNQGLNQGYSNARLQEQMAARQQLQAALAGAGGAWLAPQQANMQAQMGTQSNGQQLLNFITRGAAAFGGLGGKGGNGGGGRTA